jgi:hypothetical protein
VRRAAVDPLAECFTPPRASIFLLEIVNGRVLDGHGHPRRTVLVCKT